MRTLLLTPLLLLLTLATSAFAAEKTIRVLVWDERQPAQKKAYENFLGNAIADYLKTRPGLEVKSASLLDPELGLSKEALDNADVLIWWSHIRNGDVPVEKAKEIVERVRSGKLALIALHSAQGARPFVMAMEERTIQEAMKQVPAGQRDKAKVELVRRKTGQLTRKDDTPPGGEVKTDADGASVKIRLPNGMIRAWREAGEPTHMKTLMSEHPICKGVPATWEVKQDEMYDDPFDVPTPDQVLFQESWDKGERFKTGLIWRLGKGTVFYFQPGHETYPVYKEELPLKVVGNAVEWIAGQLPARPQ